jgi:hypothetical protein
MLRTSCSETVENYSRTFSCLKKYDSVLSLGLRPAQDYAVYKLTLYQKCCSLLSSVGEGRSQTSELNGSNCSSNLIRRLRKIAKSNYYLRYICPSVHLSIYPNGTTRLTLDGFSRNFIFEDFVKMCRENSILIKI